MELCPEMELDGNRQLTILATRKRIKNSKKYNNYKAFHASSYYLEEDQIKTLMLVGYNLPDENKGMIMQQM